MSGELKLDRLHYGLLALGDRTYRNFCGFGRRLDSWLQAQGARSLFERVEVNNADEAALREWQYHLSNIAGTRDLPDWETPAYESWLITERRHLNPGSAGHPCFHIELKPQNGLLPSWQAGDLIRVRAPGDPQRPREYSIASLPTDGAIHLLVRQERNEDGRLGVASGWLTRDIAVHSTVELCLHPHPNFQLGKNAERPLILIGNGTGLAGLRSHIKARALAGRHRNWLIFGERNAAFDCYHREEIEAWRTQGVLERTDLVFSRDQSERHYVQHRLLEAAVTLREWIEADAAVYVCGSLKGMAGGVEAALIEILGEEHVEALSATGRYRRDVY
jgi:sulfite reductase (NADPH) flavoprotein alpha-component